VADLVLLSIFFLKIFSDSFNSILIGSNNGGGWQLILKKKIKVIIVQIILFYFFFFQEGSNFKKRNPSKKKKILKSGEVSRARLPAMFQGRKKKKKIQDKIKW
jgi:hypothetical protein